ncbi:MAG: response regulator transcription factor [Nocardioides sp.]|jgi:DNA-binding NarL/FixJ family response regulator
MPDPLRLVLAEDGDLLRAGILALFEAFPEIEPVGVARSYDGLLAAVEEHRPDVVLTDIRMPPDLSDEGIRAANQLRRTHPDLGVVVLTQYADVEYALDLIADGSQGRGYLLKERVADATQLIAALKSVAAGGSVIDETVVASLLEAGSRRESSHLAALTPRELEVLTLVARGFSNGGIAEALVVGDKAVEKHINSIFLKLELPAGSQTHRRVAATLIFLTEAGVSGGNLRKAVW